MFQADSGDLPIGPFAEDTEVGKLMRSLNWSHHPLGRMEQWPRPLCMALNMALHSPSLMLLLWGPHQLTFYNDACRTLVGSTRHPRAFGMPLSAGWPEIGDAVSPWIDQVMHDGKAACVDDLLLLIPGSGQDKSHLQERFFSLALSPIWDGSKVGGVLCTCTETTQQVLGTRRLQTLRSLTAPIKASACEAVMAALETNTADLPFVLLYRIDHGHCHASLLGSVGLPPTSAARPVQIDMSGADPPWPLVQVVQSMTAMRVDDFTERFGPLPSQPGRAAPHTAVLVPVAAPEPGKSVDVLVMGVSPHQSLDEDYWGFLTLVADQVGLAIARSAVLSAHNDEPLANPAPTAVSWPLLAVGNEPSIRECQLRSIAEKSQREASEVSGQLVQALDRMSNALARLREREEILKLFITYAPIEIAMFDTQMCYLMASQRWIEDYHLESVESVLGRCHYDVLPEIPESWKQIHQQCLAGATCRCDADAFEHADGSVRWLRWEIRPWYRANQQIGGIVIFSEDITERQQIEASLQAQHKQLQQQLVEIETIYQSAPIGLNVLDRDLRFVRINQRLAEMNGIPVADHIGRTVRELLPNLADTAEHMLRPVLETGEPLLNVEITGETPAQPGVQRTWVESFWPLKDGDRVIGVSTVCEEITERKRIEAALKQANDELELRVAQRTAALRQTEATQRAILEAIPDLLIHLNQDGIRLSFISGGEVKLRQAVRFDLQQSIYETLPRELADLRMHYVRQALATGDRQRYEHVIDIDGSQRYEEVRIVKLNDQEALLMIRDVTERKQAELELKSAKEAADAANQAKSRFIANVSHELRSPLHAILGFTRIIKGDVHLPAKHREHVEIIEQSGEHLLSIINQVLDLAKVEANQVVFNPTQFSLNGLLDNLKNLFVLKAEAAGLELVIQQDPTLPASIYTDEIKLRQVLINLLDNAFKFTAQGTITLTVQRLTPADPQLHLQFAVADTGPGIAPEELSLLFKPFIQSRSGQAMCSGTGLGLAISKEFVRLMGGTLAVSSELGKGSVFQFEIATQPMALAPAQVQSDRYKVMGLQPGHPPCRLLIVDDSKINRRLLAHVLAVLDLDIRQVENGQEALSIWQIWHPHGILMDLSMPVMDGYEATRQIRQREAAQAADTRTVIIAVSASGLDLDHQPDLASAFDGSILKPFKADDIFDTLHRLLGFQYRYAD